MSLLRAEWALMEILSAIKRHNLECREEEPVRSSCHVFEGSAVGLSFLVDCCLRLGSFYDVAEFGTFRVD